MVNLELLGSLIVRGDRSTGEGVLRALALELATSRWAEEFELTLVGFGAELERFPRVHTDGDVPAVVQDLCRRQISTRARLRSAGFGSVAEARAMTRTDRWEPLVVICGPTVADDEVDQLVDAGAHPDLGMVVVGPGSGGDGSRGDGSGGHSPDTDSPTADSSDGDPSGVDRSAPPSGAVVWTSDHEGATLDLLKTVVEAQTVEADELAAVDALLRTASSREPALVSEEPYVHLPVPLPRVAAPEPTAHRPGTVPGPPGPPDPGPAEDQVGTTPSTPASPGPGQRGSPEERLAAALAPWREQPGLVDVAVLGPIDIRGAAREFTRAWARELVVYLAMHPSGASNDTWATALWPDRLMAPSSLHSTASVARRALGHDAQGNDHLPRGHGRLVLGPSVRTDWAQFVALADSDDPVLWRAALSLVRGRPFDGLRSSDWPILEGIAPSIESSIVDLAGRLSGACLRAGDPRGAEWAARQGLVVSPYDERLYRMLLRAADAAGNPAGVEAVMDELVSLVADDVEPYDSVHPSTMELYRSLTRRRRDRGTGPGRDGRQR
jgi:hypothetical protein